MKNKKKNLIGLLRFAVFSLIFMFLFVGLSNVFVPKGKNDATGMSANITEAYKAEDKNTLDVAFIGNSDIYRAVNPVMIWEDLGITSCDIGMPRMSSYEAYRKLNNLFKVQSPKLVVFEVDCMFSTVNHFGDDGDVENNRHDNLDEAINKGIDNLKENFKNLDDAILSGISYNFPLTKYKYRWKSIKAKDFINQKGKYHFYAKGFIYNKTAKPFLYGDTYMGENDGSKESFDRNADKYLEKTLELCKKNNCQLLLVSVPSGSSWNWQKHNTIADFAEKNNLQFIDYNTDMDLLDNFDWNTDTKDEGNHLNNSGARKVTKAIEKVLVNDYQLTASELTDEQTAKWEDDVKKYYKEIVKKKKK